MYSLPRARQFAPDVFFGVLGRISVLLQSFASKYTRSNDWRHLLLSFAFSKSTGNMARETNTKRDLPTGQKNGWEIFQVWLATESSGALGITH